jgi:hypothetical protein
LLQNIVILSPEKPPPETWSRLRFFRGVYFIQGTQKSRKDLVCRLHYEPFMIVLGVFKLLSCGPINFALQKKGANPFIEAFPDYVTCAPDSGRCSRGGYCCDHQHAGSDYAPYASSGVIH